MSPRKRAPAPRWRLWIALTASLGLHAALDAWMGASVLLPELEVEFQVPVDVELGLNEEVKSEAAPPPAPAELPQAPPPARAERAAKPDAGLAPDGGAGDDAAAAPDAAPADAGPPTLADAGPPGTRLPPGANIALRIDMARIRASALADDVRTLLAVIPDWRALLDGSQVDPLTELDRLLIMTPDLQREKVVLAGRYLGSRQLVLDAVERLARAHGSEASWRRAGGVMVAPWANADSTPRVIALVGPAHFTISREEDLPRLLAIAGAKAARRQGRGQRAESAADALLAMEDNEGISLEAEGVAQFIRRANTGIPQTLRLSAFELPDGRIELRGRLAYADPASAEGALAFWQKKREAYARNALVGLLGLSQPLREGVLEQDGSELHARLLLSLEHARLILAYLRELLGPRQGGPAPAGP